MLGEAVPEPQREFLAYDFKTSYFTLVEWGHLAMRHLLIARYDVLNKYARFTKILFLDKENGQIRKYFNKKEVYIISCPLTDLEIYMIFLGRTLNAPA